MISLEHWELRESVVKYAKQNKNLINNIIEQK